MRLGFGSLNKGSIGHKFVIEIWPPGHQSVLHNHGGSDGIKLMLNGEIIVREYESLTNTSKIKVENKLSAKDKTRILSFMTKDEH